MNPRSRFIDEIPQDLCDVQNYFEATAMGSYSGFSGKSFSFGSPSASYRKQDTLRSSEVNRTQSPAVASKPKAPISVEAFKTGDRVKHGKFGAGMVLSAKPTGADVMYEIAFDDVNQDGFSSGKGTVNRIILDGKQIKG